MPNIFIKKNRNFDIILTPQFYFFLEEDLEIKFTYQAKQIAPSLFDDYIEDGDEDKYQFFVYREDKKWLFFAFNIEEIFLFLESKGLKKYQIGKIYFAQELNKKLKKPLELGEKYALVDIEGVATVIPKNILDKDVEYLNLNLNKTPLKHGVSIGSSYSLISFKHTVILSLLLLLLGGAYLMEATRLKSAIESEEAKVETLLDKNPKLSSSRIRNSILEQYEPIDRLERLKRDSISKISKVLNPNIYLEELRLNNQKISALIGSDNFRNLKMLFNNKNLKEFKIKREANSIRVEREF
jgi:hypothetical protein